MQQLLRALNSERGHAGSTLPSLVGIAATIAIAIGIGRDSHLIEIVGVVVFGLTMSLALQAPHLWLRKVYRRLDRITDEKDPDRHEGFRIEL